MSVKIFPENAIGKPVGRLQQSGKIAMSKGLAWREGLETAHRQMQEAMTELITKKNYAEAEHILRAVDQLLLDLIEDMGGQVARPGVWT
jgi:hypothetical protein